MPISPPGAEDTNNSFPASPVLGYLLSWCVGQVFDLLLFPCWLQESACLVMFVSVFRTVCSNHPHPRFPIQVGWSSAILTSTFRNLSAQWIECIGEGLQQLGGFLCCPPSLGPDKEGHIWRWDWGAWLNDWKGRDHS